MNSDNLNLLQHVVPADSVTANNGPVMEQRAVPAEVRCQSCGMLGSGTDWLLIHKLFTCRRHRTGGND